MQKNKALHIVSFDIPLPANYGGVIDVYYKIWALHQMGVEIILHCFYKERKPSDILLEVCREVHYYQREMNPYLVLTKRPFITSSRKNPALFNKLMRDSHPVLFEGLHTTYFLPDLKRAGKKCYVRTHNIEHDYYKLLSKAERSVFKRIFFKIEAWKLKKYEQTLRLADGLVAISNSDKEYLQSLNNNTTFIRPFHPEPIMDVSNEAQHYAFYHGNMEVAENQKALDFLVNRVFKETDLKLIVAGKSAGKLRNPSHNKRVVFFESPSEEEMLKMASAAAVHVLPTFQPTGFKLKLMYSLYTARNIVANKDMLEGTGIEKFVSLANTVSEWREAIEKSMKQPEKKSVFKRNVQLQQKISNHWLSEQLIQFLHLTLH